MNSVFNKRKISYIGLDEQDKQTVYDNFVKQNLLNLQWISILVFLGEILLMILDAYSGFFASHPANLLNLFAELLLIASSPIYYSVVAFISTRKNVKSIVYMIVINLYKLVLIISVFCFIFTDIYVRESTLGPYLVFLFVLQLCPFYHGLKNFLLYAVIAGFTFAVYFNTVSAHGNTLFCTGVIFASFYICSDFLRTYYIKQLVNHHRVRLSNQRFERLVDQTIQALADTVEAKDNYTKGHSERVATYAQEIARRLGYTPEKQKEVYYIGLMHDVGKIGVRDDVINKKGRLTDSEYAEMKQHPVIGYSILERITELPDISSGAKWHHERYDGKGYPDGLKGEDIPMIARIVAVADAYDAMTSNRSYRSELPQATVRAEIEKNIGTQFAPEIAKVMLQMIDEDKEYTMREEKKPFGQQAV